MAGTYIDHRPSQDVYQYEVQCPCGCRGYHVSLTYQHVELEPGQQTARFGAPMNYLRDVHSTG